MIKNKRNKHIIILSFIFLIIINVFSGIGIGTVYAETKLPNQSSEFYIYDNVGIIDSNLENYIISVNKELNEKTGAQVVVAAIDSLEGLDINTYATSLFEKWKIGSSEYDNGLLILIVPSEGNIWIETGYGLEGALPAGRLKTIIERDMIPSFKDDNYNEGIESGFNSIINYIEKDYDIVLDKKRITNNNYPAQNRKGISPFLIIILLFIFGFIDIRFFKGFIILNILRVLFRDGGGYGGGGSFGGGGSSGGGGRSGGGGAGGRW